MNTIQYVEIILYVANQKQSTDFYERLFQVEPSLNVPGMTEFVLGAHYKLGLMPNSGIRRILEDRMPDPHTGIGIPRAELYVVMDDVSAIYQHAIALGVRLVSPLMNRSCGHRVCYFADPDGHVIAFAGVVPQSGHPLCS